MKQKLLNKVICTGMAVMLTGSVLGCGTGTNTEQETKSSSSAESVSSENSSNAGEKETESAGEIAGTTIRFASSALKDEATQAVWNQILDNYKEKSGVTVEMENFENAEFRTWITTQHAANNAPEVFDMNYSWAWEDYNKGYLVNFNDYLDTENPYNEDKKLGDTMSDILMQQAVNPDNGSMPGIPGRVLGVKIIYNKTMLTEAGVTELPKTYTEFKDACEKLKEKGNVPFGFANAKVNDAHMNWWLHNFVSQMDADLRGKMDLNADGFAAKNELVAATDKGMLDYTKAPFKEAIEIMKDFSSYWNSDFNSTDQNGVVDLWLSGKVAMTTVGSFQANLLTELEDLGFDYGLMQLPILTTDDYPQVTGKSLNNGGRLVDVFAVTKVEDPVKQAAAIDFVKYLLSPEVFTILMDEFLTIPPLKDMNLSEKLSGWLTTDTEDILHANYFGYATSKEFTDFQVLSSQVYLTDDMTLEDYTNELNTEWKNMCENAKTENGWSEENGYGAQ